MPHSPAFQFYPGDYLSDKNTIPMTTLEHGAYDLLWMQCWQEDGLPDDLQELADMAKMELADFTPIWNRRIKKCFSWDEKKQRYFHPRLLKEIKKQKAWSKKKSESGKKGALNRWHPKDYGDGTAMAPPCDGMAQDGSSSLSPSLFPFSSSFSSFDFKRLIDNACAEFSTSDKRLVEIAIIQTLLNRNGNASPINSIRYFEDEIQHIAKSGGISPGMLDAILAQRQKQIEQKFVTEPSGLTLVSAAK